jgi:hypothetical protein
LIYQLRQPSSKEKIVAYGLQAHSAQDEELNAYNAAFYELGFRWHWDSDTYSELLNHSPNTTERVRHYLQSRQAHLLRAYDADFLVDAIQAKKALLIRNWTAQGPGCRAQFDWSETLGSELGV